MGQLGRVFMDRGCPGGPCNGGILPCPPVGSPGWAPGRGRQRRPGRCKLRSGEPAGATPGVCSERGLQVPDDHGRARHQRQVPQIREMSGVRPDGMKWHPNGLAIDVMIPNWNAPEVGLSATASLPSPSSMPTSSGSVRHLAADLPSRQRKAPPDGGSGQRRRKPLHPRAHLLLRWWLSEGRETYFLN